MTLGFSKVALSLWVTLSAALDAESSSRLFFLARFAQEASLIRF
jgi:hypothetical protein